MISRFQEKKKKKMKGFVEVANADQKRQPVDLRICFSSLFIYIYIYVFAILFMHFLILCRA